LKIRGEADMIMGRNAPFFDSANTLTAISRERGIHQRFQGSYNQRLVQNPTLWDGKYFQIYDEACRNKTDLDIILYF
jgi:hypothetical protein